MTTLAQDSALRGAANGGVAARRAIIRWAWRMFRREWRQQILVRGAPDGRGRGRDRQHHPRLQHESCVRRRVRLGQRAAHVRRLRSAGARSSPGIGGGVVRDDGSHRPPQGSRARRRRDGGLPRAGPGWALRRRSPRAPWWQLPGRARPGRRSPRVWPRSSTWSWGRRSISTGGVGPSSASSRTHSISVTSSLSSLPRQPGRRRTSRVLVNASQQELRAFADSLPEDGRSGLTGMGSRGEIGPPTRWQCSRSPPSSCSWPRSLPPRASLSSRSVGSASSACSRQSGRLRSISGSCC